MKTLGIFEVKAKLSEICEEVARSKEPVVITRRGQPLVRIDPIRMQIVSEIWDAATVYRKVTRPTEDLELPARTLDLESPDLDL